MSVKNLPETIEMIVGFLQSESCIICTKLYEDFDSEDTLSKNICQSHFLCMKCRLKFFYLRSASICKCKQTIYNKDIKLSLNNKLEKVCINCFEYSINHESDNCLDCKRKICKNCIDNEYIINKKCNICSNRVCDECNQFLGLEFKLLENKKIVHMICPE